MPTSYSTLLGLALPVTGELSGTWGDEVNNYITQYLDSAVAGTQTISGSQTAVTLSRTTNAALSQAGSGSTGSSQYQVINCTGNPAGTLTVTVPSTSKVYLVLNNTSTSQSVVVKPSAAAGVTVSAARAALIAWNGSDFELVGTDDASRLNGILAAANGGTGQSSYAVGDTLYATGTTALSKLAIGASGRYLSSSGTAPQWSAPAALTKTDDTNVTLTLGGSPTTALLNAASITAGWTGQLSVARGGTGAATLTGYVYGNGTGAFTASTSIPNAATTATSANTANAIVARDASGNFSAGTITATLSGNATNVSGVVAVANGGTGLSSTPANGALDIGNGTGFTRATLTAGSGVSISNGSGSITISATGSGGTVTGVTATSPVASSGGTAPVISLNSAYGDTLNPYGSKTANFFLAAPNGSAGAPTFRAVVAADIPTLNQNTTGTAANITASSNSTLTTLSSLSLPGSQVSGNISGSAGNVTGTVAVANGGTGSTTAGGARTNLGATTVGANFFTLTNPTAVTFPRINADNTVSALDAATFRSAIGAGTGSGTVTSVATSGSVNGITLTGGTITSTGTITLGGTLSGVSLTTQVSGTLPIANGGTGTTSTQFVNLASNVTGTLPAGNGGTGNAFFSVSGPASSVKTYTFPNENMSVGYRNLPPSGTRTTSYTLTTSDVGKYVQVGSGGSITIPTSTFAEGDAITLFNNTTGNITITCSAPTAYIAGTNTVKTSMTLATRGVATILFISATLCVVTGNVT
jgi:hypothetical protein